MSQTLAMLAGSVGVGKAPAVSGFKYLGVVIVKQKRLFELDYELVWA
ncbi:MAG: hypothetical protein AAF773_09075 [Cyanobacteria bacterium P01_D01_bin.115]